MNKFNKQLEIAEWLGWEFDEWDMLIPNNFIKSKPIFKSDLKFDSDSNWQWLCLKKIKKVVNLPTMYHTIVFLNNILERNIDSELDIFEAIVIFTERYE